jgi:hypothetical protein
MRQSLKEQNLEGSILRKAFKDVESPEDKDSLPLVAAYSLALWALNGKQSGNGYGFPFDRPLLQFAERVFELNRRLPELLKLIPRNKGRRPLRRLAKRIFKSVKDPDLIQAVKELRWRAQIFDDLRKAMRIAPADGQKGLNDDGTREAMFTIREGVEEFYSLLKEDLQWANDVLCLKMKQQIEKYSDRLFADPIKVDTPNGNITIYPQRTNNILEQFFRGLRRGHRRRTGNNSMHRTLQAMLAETPLVKNLNNPEYMKILLEGKSNLEDLFASLEQNPGFNHKESKNGSDQILPGFRSIIKFQNLPEQITDLFAKVEQATQSN